MTVFAITNVGNTIVARMVSFLHYAKMTQQDVLRLQYPEIAEKRHKSWARQM